MLAGCIPDMQLAGCNCSWVLVFGCNGYRQSRQRHQLRDPQHLGEILLLMGSTCGFDMLPKLLSLFNDQYLYLPKHGRSQASYHHGSLHKDEPRCAEHWRWPHDQGEPRSKTRPPTAWREARRRRPRGGQQRTRRGWLSKLPCPLGEPSESSLDSPREAEPSRSDLMVDFLFRSYKVYCMCSEMFSLYLCTVQ